MSSSHFPVVAVIPARGGSKRLPRKNLREVNGRTLVCRAIDAARESKFVNKICLSTDDGDIADAAASDDVLIVNRPKLLANDSAEPMGVVLHALDEIGVLNPAAIAVLLQPTSPLRKATHIDECIKLVLQGKPAAISVVEATQHPRKMFRMASGVLSPLFSKADLNKPKQELELIYSQNGAVYAIRRCVLEEENTFCPTGSVGYVMSPDESIDVDTELDLLIAETIANANHWS